MRRRLTTLEAPSIIALNAFIVVVGGIVSTDKLIKRIINGDVSAFDLLYEQTRKSVYYVALSVLRDKRLAEDVMQSTYIKVLQNVSRYRLGTNASDRKSVV